MSALVPRILGFVLAGLLLLWASADFLNRANQLSEVTSRLDDLGAVNLDPDLMRRVEREPDPVRAHLVAGRGLLAIEADPATFADLSPAERRTRALAGIDSLRLSRDLAGEVLETRPGSWQAHLILGASTFLEKSRSGGPQRPDDWSSWEEPLTLAHRLAPAQREPLKFLGAAYVNEWSRLDDSRRDSALPVLARALEDPATLDLLVGQWLRVAPSLETALSILPNTSKAWTSVSRYHRSRSDWERDCLALERADRALHRELLQDVATATDRSRAGDVAGARSILLTVLNRMPVYEPFDEVVEAFLRRLPPGPVPRHSAQSLQAWFEWSRERCLQGACSLDQRVVARLATLAEMTEPARTAEAAIMAGDLPRAEVYERRAFESRSDDWAPFLVLKSRLLADRGNTREAWDTLARVPISWRSRAEYALAVKLVDQATDNEVSAVASTGQNWSPSTWTRSAKRWEIEIPGRWTDRVLELEVSPVAADGASVQLLWNGRHAGFRPVAGSTRIRLAPVTWLEFNQLAVAPSSGGRIRVGQLRLSEPSPGDSRPRPRPRESASPRSQAD